MALQGTLLPVSFLFFIGGVGLANRRTLRFCATALVVGVAADALLVASGSGVNSEGRAMLGGGYDPNDTAALLVATIPIALVIGGRRGILGRVFFGAIAFLALAALVKTGSRGGLLGLVAMFVALIAVSRGRQRMNVIAFAVGGGLLFGGLAKDQLGERFRTVLTVNADYNMSEEDGRIEVWKRGLGYMMSNPVLGVGFDNFPIAEGTLSSKAQDASRRRGIRFTAAHNAFVQIGAELGVIGLAAFVTMIVTAAVGCWRVARDTSPEADPDDVAWARAAFVAIFGLTVSAIFLSLAYHAMLACVITLCTGVIVSSAARREGAAGAVAAAAPVPDAGAGWRSRRSAGRLAPPPAPEYDPDAPAATLGRRGRRAARGWRTA
jgi:O-antigen ligase